MILPYDNAANAAHHYVTIKTPVKVVWGENQLILIFVNCVNLRYNDFSTHGSRTFSRVR